MEKDYSLDFTVRIRGKVKTDLPESIVYDEYKDKLIKKIFPLGIITDCKGIIVEVKKPE